ncbi:MAG: hypothetical protein K9L74_07695 [Candidatus Izimaplasma sp.]|nr:hypothetical protein [Candidatus Izimaplasma bacterium]
MCESIHDNCGGIVEYSKCDVYPICQKCGRFAFLYECDGNSESIKELSKRENNERYIDLSVIPALERIEI